MQHPFFINYLKKDTNITPADRLLLHLFFSKSPSKEDIDALWSNYDVNNAHLEFSLLVGLLKKRHPEVEFPKSIIPQLDGILRFLQVKNAVLLQGFNEIATELNKKGIPILLTKGIAMKYFRPDEPRYMSDVDFIVPEELYDEAVKTANDLGFSGGKISHSADLSKGDVCVDIHRSFLHGKDKRGAAVLRNMFANAKKTSAFGVDVLIPSPEDFMLLMLSNAYHNIAVQPSIHISVCYYFFDCARLIEDNKDLDWDAVCAAASESGILYQIQTFLELLNWLFPSFLPEELLAKIAVNSEEHTTEQLKNDMLFRINDKLLQQQKMYRLSDCKNIPEVIFALKIRIKRVLWAVVRKNNLII